MYVTMDYSTFYYVSMLLAAASACLYASSSIITIRSNKCAVIERYGVFRCILRPGMHLIWHPFDRAVRVNWSYLEERERSSGSSSCYSHQRYFCDNIIPVQNVKLDSVPAKAYTNDHVRVDVNGTLHYRIVDIRKAVYETDDLLDHLCQIIAAATRAVMSQRGHGEIIGHESQIAGAIMNEITGMSARYGVECTEFIVQDVSMDKRIVGAIEGAIASEQVNSVEIAKKRHAHDMTMARQAMDHAQTMAMQKNAAVERESAHANRLAELDYLERETTKQTETDLLKTRAELNMESERARRSADDVAYAAKALMDVGGSVQDYITLTGMPYMSNAASGADKWFVVPTEHMSNMASLPLASALYGLQNQRK
jgi:regulator of protease activity HflC (stomatin/prohibitin superfamily)